jgi:NAD(P)-dependent dehydrogenase (short-subunit alcohol dehydrogenase family)
MKLENKVALVTGGGSGMGRATAKLLAAEGARVGVLDFKEEGLREVIAEIEAAGGQALPLLADVSQPDQMQAAVQKLIEIWGRLDIVFANAGINGLWAPIEEIEPEEWDRTMAINLKGVFLTFKYSVPHLRRQGGAAVITSSVQGTRLFSIPGSTAYACTKAAQVTMAKKLALELARDNIRVNAICPGATATNIGLNTERRNLEKIQIPVEYPAGRIPLDNEFATPEDIAHLVLFLVSDDSRMITGTEVWIDGALSLLVG